MHDRLLEHQDRLAPHDPLEQARALDLDLDRFREDLVDHRHSARVARDAESADLSGVAGTPTFFINGRPTTARTTSRRCRRRSPTREREP